MILYLNIIANSNRDRIIEFKTNKEVGGTPCLIIVIHEQR